MGIVSPENLAKAQVSFSGHCSESDESPRVPASTSSFSVFIRDVSHLRYPRRELQTGKWGGAGGHEDDSGESSLGGVGPDNERGDEREDLGDQQLEKLYSSHSSYSSFLPVSHPPFCFSLLTQKAARERETHTHRKRRGESTR